jgi:hypothetical protein
MRSRKGPANLFDSVNVTHGDREQRSGGLLRSPGGVPRSARSSIQHGHSSRGCETGPALGCSATRVRIR